MLRGYADEHVSAAIVESLRIRGMDVVTVQERGRGGNSDATVLGDALREGRMVLTNDAHFLGLAARASEQGDSFAPIVFWPQQRRGVGVVVRGIIRIASAHSYDEALSQVYYL